ncbi:Fur family zinc uptake transcriptional regulator [Pantoea sp. PA1]|jgi:Fur family zinc uptake transcriptional regulator|uniref:zinc uptake transcriptional repressor Zur n=1 Tax=Pantoea ananas TaxID=553 RepID=UPI001B30AAB6|nr:zinc uptake transcriptional repressor Zur [Pantoea ananatis]MDH0053983.1 zinc uptake transcriptional repressor Zur [Pantoea ananatis]
MSTMTPEQIMTQAEKLCLQRGVRLTTQRAEVLRLMAGQPGSISAYDLLDQLRVSEPQAKPPTVYRALDFLLEQGFIHRVESNNSYVMCHHFEAPAHTSVMLVCDRCAGVTEKQAQGAEQIIASLAEEAHFILRNSVIEAHGLCENCAEVEACEQHEHCDHDHHTEGKKRGKRG